MEKAEFIQKNDPEMYQVLQKRVEKLIKDKSINGHDLKKIYISVKDLPFEENITYLLKELKDI